MTSLRQRNKTSQMESYKIHSRTKHIPNHFTMMKKSERIAWIIVCFQFLVILSNRHSWSSSTSSLNNMIRGSDTISSSKTITTATNPNQLKMNDHTQTYYDNKKRNGTPFYDSAVIHPESAGLVSRVWHSNGFPSVNPNLQTGSCWCGADEWCMCSAALAIDCILTSGDYFWLVQRQDTGQYATMGGFVEVGESSAETVVREMKEEMNVDIPSHRATLFGVYSDPQRDARRHTASIVYHLEIPGEEPTVKAGDDAKKVVKVHMDEIDNLDFFADHKTILKDFISQKKGATALSKDDPIQRNVCLLN